MTSSSQIGVGAEVGGVVVRVTTSLVAFPKPGGRRGEREGAERERERGERGSREREGGGREREQRERERRERGRGERGMIHALV